MVGVHWLGGLTSSWLYYGCIGMYLGQAYVVSNPWLRSLIETGLYLYLNQHLTGPWLCGLGTSLGGLTSTWLYSLGTQTPPPYIRRGLSSLSKDHIQWSLVSVSWLGNWNWVRPMWSRDHGLGVSLDLGHTKVAQGPRLMSTESLDLLF